MNAGRAAGSSPTPIALRRRRRHGASPARAQWRATERGGRAGLTGRYIANIERAILIAAS